MHNTITRETASKSHSPSLRDFRNRKDCEFQDLIDEDDAAFARMSLDQKADYIDAQMSNGEDN